MRVDAYTKMVLTVIAGCLIWLCVHGSGATPVSAQAPQEVVIVGVRGAKTVLTVRPAGDWYQAPLPVDAPRGLATRLIGVERGDSGRWDAVDVNVREQPRKTTPGH